MVNARILIGAVLALAAAGCEKSDPAAEEAATPATVEQAAQDIAPPGSSSVPNDFAETGWRVDGEDGARYTTYLDEGGTYRDLRNGDPWQTGTWTYGEDDELCLEPDAEGGVQRCWHPQRMRDDGTMIATSDGDRRIALRKVDYRLPAAEPDTDTEEASGR